MLRRVRVDGAGRRVGVHVLLRNARRDGRLDHRLGPDPGADARCLGRRAGLEHLPGDLPRRDRHHLALLRRAGRLRRLPLGSLQPCRRAPGGRADDADRHRHQGVAAGQPRPGGGQALHRPVRDHRRPVLRVRCQLPPVHPAGSRPDRLQWPHAAAAPGHLRDRATDLRRARHHLRGVRGLLRLHRLRRRRDHRGGGQQPAEGPAQGAFSARWRSARCSTWRSRS